MSYRQQRLKPLKINWPYHTYIHPHSSENPLTLFSSLQSHPRSRWHTYTQAHSYSSHARTCTSPEHVTASNPTLHHTVLRINRTELHNTPLHPLRSNANQLLKLARRSHCASSRMRCTKAHAHALSERHRRQRSSVIRCQDLPDACADAQAHAYSCALVLTCT